MSYKEIQVPSNVITEVYQEALSYLKPLIEKSIKKVEENHSAKLIFEKQEEETYETLVQALKEVLPQWRVYGSIDGVDLAILRPTQPWHLYDGFSYYTGQDNVVIQHYNMCKSMLQGASLSEEVTLTESQVADFKFYQENCYKEHVEEWLNKVPEFTSQYDEDEVHKIVSFVQRKKAKLQTTVHEKVAAPAQDHIKDYNPADFWHAFFFIASALLVVLGIVKCS